MAEELKASGTSKKEKEDHQSNGENSSPIQCTSLSNNTELMKIARRMDSIPDDTDLPNVSATEDGESNEEQSVASGPRGLGLLVQECFGRPLDKSQQLSDWEKRPLKPEQMYYAGMYVSFNVCMCAYTVNVSLVWYYPYIALDAFCLLEVYEHLKKRALAISPDFNTKPFLTSAVTGKAVFKFVSAHCTLESSYN